MSASLHFSTDSDNQESQGLSVKLNDYVVEDSGYQGVLPRKTRPSTQNSIDVDITCTKPVSLRLDLIVNYPENLSVQQPRGTSVCVQATTGAKETSPKSPYSISERSTEETYHKQPTRKKKRSNRRVVSNSETEAFSAPNSSPSSSRCPKLQTLSSPPPSNDSYEAYNPPWNFITQTVTNMFQRLLVRIHSLLILLKTFPWPSQHPNNASHQNMSSQLDAELYQLSDHLVQLRDSSSLPRTFLLAQFKDANITYDKLHTRYISLINLCRTLQV